MKTWLLASVALLSVAAAQPAAAALLIYKANLTGAAEVPPAATPGSGFTVITYDDVLQTLRVQVTFQDLLGLTTASHIHVRPNDMATTGGVITQIPSFPGFPTGVNFGTYDQTFNMALATSYNPSFLSGPIAGGSTTAALAYLLDGLADGRAYLNVHTTRFPPGEIRGDLAAVPEPGTWGLMITGFGLVGAVLRRGYRFGRNATSALPGC